MRPPENRPPEYDVNRSGKQSRSAMIGFVALALLVIIVLVWWVDGGNQGVQTLDGAQPTAPEQQSPGERAVPLE